MSGIYWGELAGLADGFELTRTVGFEPWVAIFPVERSQVLDWAMKTDRERFKGLDGSRPVSLPAIAAQLKAAVPATFRAAEALPFKADLVVASERVEGRDDDEAPPLKLRDFYLVGARLSERYGELEVIELVLADVAFWWGDYGELTRDFNVRTGIADDGVPIFDRRTLHGARRPHAPREIVQAALDALPGKPQLVEWPADVEGEAGVALEVRAAGACPRDVARGIVDELGLVFVRNLDGSAAAWRPGRGLVGESSSGLGAGNDRVAEPGSDFGVWRGFVPDETNSYHARHAHEVPTEVLVQGARPVFTVAVDFWTPVVPYERRDAEGRTRLDLLEVKPGLLTELATLFARPAATLGAASAAAAAGFLPGAGSIGLLAGSAAAATLGPSRFKGDERRTDVVASSPGDPVAAEGSLLLRLPLADGSAEPPLQDVAMLESFPTELREVLRRGLFRVFQIPERYRHLLPLLDRAERDVDGVRHGLVVEAYGWKAVEVDLSGEVPESTQRSEKVRELDALFMERSAVRERIRKLDLPTVQSVTDALTLHVGALLAGVQPATTWSIDDLTGVATDALDFARDAGKAGGGLRGFLSAAAERIVEKVQRFGAVEFGKQLGLDEKALDRHGYVLAELKAQEQDLTSRITKLEEELDPATALLAQLNAANRALAESQALGKFDLGLADQVAKLGKAIDEVRRAAPDADRQKTRKHVETIHVNLPRRPVPFTVLDAERGLIALESPAGWLADPFNPVVSNTFLVPMPVRVIFGSWNREPEALSGAGAARAANPFLKAAVVASLRDEDVRQLAGDVGHMVPAAATPGLTRFAFTDRDLSGEAQVGPYAFRVTDPELQLLTELPTTATPEGKNNRAELLAAAKRRAEQIMAPRTAESGGFLVVGARPVNLTGRVTAVRHQSDGDGNVDTVVSLDRFEPLPGWAPIVPPRAPGPLVFGFDAREVR